MTTSVRHVLATVMATLICGCAVPGDGPAAARATTTAKPPSLLKRAPRGERIPLSEILKKTRADLDDMMHIYRSHPNAARSLGALNTSFHRRGYFRRVPGDPALVALESNLRSLALSNDLRLQSIRHQLQPKPTMKATSLKPGERWQPTLEQLRGVVQLEIDLKGDNSQIAAFIDQIVTRIEQLLVLTGNQTIPGGIKLFGETYYEHNLQQPRVHIRWPTLAQRLQEAGWDANDPQLPINPTYVALRDAIKTGRQRLPEVHDTLNITAGFPIWFLRQSFYEERSTVAVSMRGDLLLGTVVR